MRSIFAVVAFVALTTLTLGVSAAPSLAPPGQPRVDSAAVQVQGRACRACRRDCYYDYRTACGYSQSCRTAFTRCMRSCWDDLCR